MDGITDLVDMSLSQLQELVMDWGLGMFFKNANKWIERNSLILTKFSYSQELRKLNSKITISL